MDIKSIDILLLVLLIIALFFLFSSILKERKLIKSNRKIENKGDVKK